MPRQSSEKTAERAAPARRPKSQPQSQSRSRSQSKPARSQSQAKSQSESQSQSQSQSADLVSRFGSLEIDWPRSAGYFGGVALAVGIGMIEPPLGAFIVAIPFVKMLDLPRLSSLPRFVAQVFEGVAKPVGGDSQGTVRIVTPRGASDEPVQQGG